MRGQNQTTALGGRFTPSQRPAASGRYRSPRHTSLDDTSLAEIAQDREALRPRE